MNAKTKHTPGPWTVIPAVPYDGDESEFEGAYTSPASIEGADGNPVCVFGSAEGSGSLFENEADYHLIVAAPDLFEALANLRAHISFDARVDSQQKWDVMCAADAALSKAGG